MPQSAGQPPSLVRRPIFWVLVAAAVAILAAVTIVVLNRLIYNPQAAVEEYLDALRAGEGDRALAISKGYLPEDAPETISTVLLDGEPLAASAAPLEHAELAVVETAVPERYQDPERTQRVVEIQYEDAAEEPHTTSLVVDKTGTSWLFFHEWELHPVPLQQVQLKPQQMPEKSKADEPVAHVHDAPTPLLGDSDTPATLAAFAPSVIELEYQGTYIEVAEPVNFAVSDVLAPGAPAEMNFEVDLTDAVDETISEEVQNQLQRCTDQTVLKPAGCPFGYETSHRVVADTVSWSIANADVEYSWENSEPTIDQIIATAQLTAEEIHIGTGQQSTVNYEEVFEMTAELELTPENIRIRPDWR